jgi:putative ABC transport system ATP-binding protein
MAAVIELKNITKTYRLGDEEFNALDNVSFTVSAGQFIAITGPPGSIP